ncbi:hypothetical protein E5288_WYG012063 [Bos mutus]|uniref:Uncharacterized protein n=1 Tax=Bos mutus TaxID=72004 RepID=A0A6B0R1S8_9CETA|nr:hypothetical protein [Bos mutus]
MLSVTSFQHSDSSGFVVLTQAVVRVMGGEKHKSPGIPHLLQSDQFSPSVPPAGPVQPGPVQRTVLGISGHKHSLCSLWLQLVQFRPTAVSTCVQEEVDHPLFTQIQAVSGYLSTNLNLVL